MNGDKRNGAFAFGSRQEPCGEDIVQVTHVATPTMFYGQRQSDMLEMIHISESLANVCPSSSAVSGQPCKDKIYACKFSEDDLWYRCEVSFDKQGAKKVRVRFVDYGNEEEKNYSELIELPTALSSKKRMSSTFVLYGIKPNYEKATSGHQQGREVLKSLICYQQCKVQVYPSIGQTDYIPLIVENQKGQDVNQAMLDEGFAEKIFVNNNNKPKVQQSGDQRNTTGRPDSQGGRNNQGTWNRSKHANLALLEQLKMNSAGSAAANGVNQQQTHPGQTQAQFQVQQNVQGGGWHSTAQTSHSQPHSATGQAQLQSGSAPITDGQSPVIYLQTITALKSKLDATNGVQQRLLDELASTREALQAQRSKSSVEIAGLRRTLMTAEQDKQSAVQDASLNTRMKTLVEGVNKVKELRTQFPTDQNVVDGIQAALSLVTDKTERIVTDLDVTKCVREKLEVYNAAQEAIRTCKNKPVSPHQSNRPHAVYETVQQACLDHMIGSRDVARRELHAAITTFSDVVSQLPLKLRSSELVNRITPLTTSHSNFLKLKSTHLFSIAEIVESYTNWTMTNQAKFEAVRTRTNTVHNAVSSMLARLRQMVSLDMPACSDDTTHNLDDQISRFIEAVREEIAVTDMEKKDDSRFIAEVLHTLMSEMQRELQDIENLRALDVQYRHTKDEISEWLESTPDLMSIKAVRTTIKGLKSKLRHKMADLSDLEESEDSDRDELSQIGVELAAMRGQLHAAFVEEETLLAKLAVVTDTHFPELLLNCAELGLANELEYGGLVKLGRSLTQYDTNKCMKDKSSVRQTSFNGSPVILKEFLVGQNVGVSKDEFLSRAQAFHKVNNQHLMPLQAVFFQQGDQHAFIQMQQYTHNLVQYATDNAPLTDEVVYEITKCIAMALQALHSAGIVHGAVHPNNVLVNDNQAILADYEFAKSQSQRCEKPWSKHGLKFCGCELLRSPAALTPQSDMYCLGLVALYMCQPNQQFSLAVNHVPQYSLEGVPAFMKQLIDNLVSDAPHKRYTAAMVMSLPYMKDSPYRTSAATPVSNPEDTVLQLQRKSPPITPGSTEKHGILKPTSPVTSTPVTDLAVVDSSSPAPPQVQTTDSEITPPNSSDAMSSSYVTCASPNDVTSTSLSTSASSTDVMNIDVTSGDGAVRDVMNIDVTSGDSAVRDATSGDGAVRDVTVDDVLSGRVYDMCVGGEPDGAHPKQEGVRTYLIDSELSQNEGETENVQNEGETETFDLDALHKLMNMLCKDSEVE